MSGLIRLEEKIEISSGLHGHHRIPRRGAQEVLLAVDEAAVYSPLTVAANVTDAPIPGIGPAVTDITTVKVFKLFAYGEISLKWNGSAAIPLKGTAAVPAMFMVFQTEVTDVPTVSNASGSPVECAIVVAGT